MKKIIITLFSIAAMYTSNAQEYAFSILNQPYQALDTNNANFKPVYGKLNHFSDTWGGVSQVHDDFPFPFPFKRVSTNTTIDRFIMGFTSCGAAYKGSDFGINMSPSTNFSRSNYGLCDRAYDSTIGSELYKAKSYIGYMVEGSQPNRILKIEYNNCKFYKSKPEDSLYVQVWMYEKDNSIEFHYGPSSITTNYDSLEGYSQKAMPVVKGMITRLIIHEGSHHDLEGNPISPNYKVYSDINAHPEYALSALPPNGAVYRFDPNKVVGINYKIQEDIRIFPNPVYSYSDIMIDWDSEIIEIEVYSLDGRFIKQVIPNQSKFCLEGIDTGTYILKLKAKGKPPIIKKLVVI